MTPQVLEPVRPARPVDLGLSPARAVARWPRDAPLAAVWSGAAGRWTILAAPSFGLSFDAPGFWSGGGPGAPALSGRVHEDLARLLAPSGRCDAGALPFAGGWLGMVCYEFGATLEPAAATRRRPAPPSWPLMHWARCPGALVHDGAEGCWWAVGDPDAVPDLQRRRPVRGRSWRAGPVRATTGEGAYRDAVARAIEYIRAGDVFQVNLAHLLTAPFSGSSRALLLDLAHSAEPAYGAYLELPGSPRRAVISVSPELFLRFDPGTRRIETHPMKGTRPAGADPRELRDAPKDRAELNMIIDLMRNDLGRVCEYGTVRVEDPRIIQHHGAGRGGVLQAIARVAGRLRPDLTFADALAAAFPPGSVTGAPKIRAMQIIDELEPSARGPYCGAIGYASACGRCAFNVAIRTAMITGEPGADADDIREGTLGYPVGAGIVADSSPSAEWAETLDKAGVLRQVLDSSARRI